MAKKGQKNVSIKWLLITIVVAACLYLLVLLGFSGAEVATSNQSWVVAVHDHAQVVLTFINNYGFILVLLVLAVFMIYALRKKRKY